MSSEPSVSPFVGESAFPQQPSLPDLDKKEALGSGIVTKLLGHGGMANVYEIWIANLEVYRAVKIIKPDCTKDSLERFQTEIKILAKLRHQNIIHIHSVGEWKGLPFIEMDKIDGWTLTELILDKGALPHEVSISLAILTTRAMAYAHTHKFQIYGTTYKGVVHRDLKPGNIMLCKSGEVVLMDFGVARPADASFHTMDGAVVGTIQYMSPELLAGKKLNFKTDIYALGATLYELLTASNPFPETNFSKLITIKQRNKFRHLNEYDLKIPRQLKKIVHRCLNTDPNKRFNTTQDLLIKLELVHKAISNENPETVVARYVKSLKPGNRYVPKTKFYISNRVIFTAILILATLFGLILGTNKVIEKNRLKKLAKTTSEKIKMHEVDKAPKNNSSNNDQLIKKTVKRFSKESNVKKINKKSAPKINKIQKTKPLKSMSQMNILAEKYGTSNPSKLLSLEFAAKKYKSVLSLYEQIPIRKLTDKNRLIYMKALQKLNRRKDLNSFLAGAPINDAEFYLAQAINAYNIKSFRIAESRLEKSLISPKQFIDYTTLKQQVFYYKAKIASNRFDRFSNEDTYKRALEEWRNLGALYSSDRTNSKFKEYRAETRRLGIKYQKLDK